MVFFLFLLIRKMKKLNLKIKQKKTKINKMLLTVIKN
jgi:hypothetical protein